MVMLKLKRLAHRPRRHSELRTAIKAEVSSMARADAIEAYVQHKCQKA